METSVKSEFNDERMDVIAKLFSIFSMPKIETLYEEINNIIDEFIKDEQSKEYIKRFDYVEKLSEKVLKMKKTTITSETYSRKIDLNETIKIVYNFFKSIDISMANQFMNIISYVDENNKPCVNFIPKNNYEQESFVDINGIVHFYYSNTPEDIFDLGHEVLHVMNRSIVNTKDGLTMTMTNNYFTEAVSLLYEELIGDFVVRNEYITENDFNILKCKRLRNTKFCALNIIFELELIKMKLKGIKISEENFTELLNSYDKPSIKYIIMSEGYKDISELMTISENGLKVISSQRYVIGAILTKELLNSTSVKDDFINLNHEVGNANSNIDNIMEEFVKKMC